MRDKSCFTPESKWKNFSHISFSIDVHEKTSRGVASDITIKKLMR